MVNSIFNSDFKFRFLHVLLSFLISSEKIYAEVSGTQEVTIVGRVSDSKKNPIYGVLVEDVNGGEQVMTDQNGQYSILISSSETSLRFSHVGFEEQEIVLS